MKGRNKKKLKKLKIKKLKKKKDFPVILAY